MLYRYTGEPARVFSDIQLADGSTLDAEPGEVYDLRKAPPASVADLFQAVDAKTKPAPTNPLPEPAVPAVDTPKEQ